MLLYDARPFFEKALQYGIQHGLIDAATLDAITRDAPKGMVQIARYFGNEFLRPDLEKARERIVNLVSLFLEHSTGGNLVKAAQSLQQHSFLSRSKAGSDLLKTMLAMPQNSHFGLLGDPDTAGRFTDAQIALLAKWTLRPLADYQAELAKRTAVAQVIDAAFWCADAAGLAPHALYEAGKDAEAVIRSALLLHAAGQQRIPDWSGFEKMVRSLRQRAAQRPLALALPAGLPAEFAGVAQVARAAVLADLPKILDATLPVRQLFDRTPGFIGRYFWLEDALADVVEFDTQQSKVWDKVTGGQTDEGALLSLFLCVAAGSTPKTLLCEKSATALVRKIHKSGLNGRRVQQYIADHAPVQYQADYNRLWANFADEAQGVLTSDAVFAVQDALALLRRECQVK